MDEDLSFSSRSGSSESRRLVGSGEGGISGAGGREAPGFRSIRSPSLSSGCGSSDDIVIESQGATFLQEDNNLKIHSLDRKKIT